MQIIIHIAGDDLSQEQKFLLQAGQSEYGTSVGTYDEKRLRAANELVQLGLLSDSGLLRPDYRHRMFHATIAGRAFLRQAE